jgi:hypothetical protein
VQGMPGAGRTRSLVCEEGRKAHKECHYRLAENIPALPAQWLYGLLRALPGVSGLIATVARISANLTPASRGQDHTASPYAVSALVSRTARVHRIPHHVS